MKSGIEIMCCFIYGITRKTWLLHWCKFSDGYVEYSKVRDIYYCRTIKYFHRFVNIKRWTIQRTLHHNFFVCEIWFERCTFLVNWVVLVYNNLYCKWFDLEIKKNCAYKLTTEFEISCSSSGLKYTIHFLHDFIFVKKYFFLLV